MIKRQTNIGALEKNIANAQTIADLTDILSQLTKSVQTEFDWVEKNVFDETTNINSATTADWGEIAGTISDQTDLMGLFGGKSDTTHNHDGVYSLITHNHDLAYSAIGHNHDLAYSALGHTHAGVYEPALGNPGVDGYVLSSTAVGVRSWVANGGMTYPGSGIAVSTGSAWGTSITDNSANWNTAYGWGNHASVGYLTSQTSHADVIVDGDFTSQGIMLRGASSGVYSILTDNSANWNTAYGWGNWASNFGSTTGKICQGDDSRLSDSRTPTAHTLNGALHTVSGLTTGHFLKATSATTFGFAAHGLTYSDVGASASGHNHSGVYEPVITAGTTAQYWRGDKSWQTLNQAAVAGLTTGSNVTFNTLTLGGGELYFDQGTYDGILIATTLTATRYWTFPNVGGNILISANNLSDVGTVATARTNLGLGTANTPQFASLGLGTAGSATNLIHTYNNSATNTTVHGRFENINAGGRAQFIVTSETYPNNFFALMTHGGSVSDNYYPTTSGAVTDAGKAILLAQGSGVSEFIIGTYNSDPVGIFTNNVNRLTVTTTGVIKLDHLAELTASHGVVFDNALTGVSVAVTGALTSSGGGVGYTTGAGGTVTQLTSRTTGVTLNKLCGTITMVSAAQAANALVTFTLTNSFIAATDFVLVQHISATNGGAWNISVVAGVGSCTINIRNVSTASITEATPLRFVIIKSVTS